MIDRIRTIIKDTRELSGDPAKDKAFKDKYGSDQTQMMTAAGEMLAHVYNGMTQAAAVATDQAAAKQQNVKFVIDLGLAIVQDANVPGAESVGVVVDMLVPDGSGAGKPEVPAAAKRSTDAAAAWLIQNGNDKSAPAVIHQLVNSVSLRVPVNNGANYFSPFQDKFQSTVNAPATE